MTDDIKEVLVSEEQIQELTKRIADQITEDYKNSSKKNAICKSAIDSITAIMTMVEDSYRYNEIDTLKMFLYNDITY